MAQETASPIKGKDIEARAITATSLTLSAQSITIKCVGHAKVGATAGWTSTAGTNLGFLATLAAGATGATLVVKIDGLRNGDIITGFAVNGSIQSAGNTSTLLADLRKLTAAAAGATDASVGVMAAALSVTANTVVSAANAAKTGLAEVVAAGESFYILITSTTAASTTQEVQSIDLTVTRASV